MYFIQACSIFKYVSYLLCRRWEDNIFQKERSLHMPRFVRWMQGIWNWRNSHPTASCVVTGLWGVFGLLAGIVSFTSNSIGGGVLLSLLGAGLLGLVIYAGYDTSWFQNWKYKDAGSVVEGHSLARSIGPITLSTAVLATVVYVGLLYLTTKIIGAVTSS